MSLDLAAFRALRREFDEVSDAKVQGALTSAIRRTDATVFLADTDDAVMWLAAHLLSADPTGQSTRVKGEGFGTLYLTERTRLEDIYCPLSFPGTDASADACLC